MTSVVKSASSKIAANNQLKCRHCGAIGLDRISRGYLAKLLFFWLPLQHFICYRCLKKQYKLQGSS